MINVTFSVDLSALERSFAKGACCGESQAASHIVLLLLWLFKAIESTLWPSSAFNEGFLRPAHYQPQGRRGSRGVGHCCPPDFGRNRSKTFSFKLTWITGKSLSEALILTSTDCPWNSLNKLLSYCGSVDARTSSSSSMNLNS